MSDFYKFYNGKEYFRIALKINKQVENHLLIYPKHN